ncbi:MAG: signal recognition particle-docking protein FtsY [Actinobacteria bacterium]|nr:signal recognition particle-docking protein FtsY [Actinomycetota bacterium]
MNAQHILLILLGVTLVFGLGVVVFNRRSGSPHTTPLTETRPVDESTIAAPVTVPRSNEEAFEVTIADETGSESKAEPEPVERPSFRERMARTATAMAGVFGGVRARGGITADTWDDLEEALLKADVGVGVTDALLDGLRSRAKAKEIETADALLAALQSEMSSRLAGADRTLHLETVPDGHVNVWLFVGVNGVGKTTTIGKVAAQQVSSGRSVLLAAGDTFRAAAAEQLGTWAERSGAELVRGNEGGDPSSVIFDGVQRAAAKGVDLVLGDTAGRLQNKSNLMDELRKVRRVAGREPGVVSEVLLVIDATTGQNGLAQAREFAEAAGVTGVVLSKLDGSAKGGIVFAIETELGIPVKLVGLGETIADLVDFDPDDFVAALFGA